MTQEELKAIRHYRDVVAKEQYTQRDLLFLTEVNGNHNVNKTLEAYLNN